jgi:thiol-disulfide isomerase/thioredoxin
LTYLAAALGIVAAGGIFNLLLTFGVIRRLKEHTRLLDQQLAGGSHMTAMILPAGSQVDEFTAVAIDGGDVTLADLGDEALIGFFSPTCGPCKAQLPVFMETAGGLRESVRVVAVVLNGETGSEEMAERLSPVARVVSESHDGPIVSAFRVTAFPSFAYVAQGAVTATGNAVDEVTPVTV